MRTDYRNDAPGDGPVYWQGPSPHERLRAAIAEALGIYPAEQDVDAILRACLEAVEGLPRANAAGHCIGKTLVRYADLRALFTGGAAKP